MKEPSAIESIFDLIQPFIASIASGRVEIYNEFSVQHELGIFLRSRLTGYKVQFERNVGHFFANSHFSKRELDIAVFSADPRELRYALELKYPRNGQYPEQMFSFCKDVAFLEELQSAGCPRGAFVTFADDKLFYSGNGDGIYGYFRSGVTLHGRILKPTGQKDEEVVIKGHYQVHWKPVRNELRYAVVEAPGGTGRA